MKKTKIIKEEYHVCDTCEKDLTDLTPTVYDQYEFCTFKCAVKLLGEEIKVLTGNELRNHLINLPISK